MNHSDDIQKEAEQLRRENRQLLEQIEQLNQKLMESEAFKSHFLSNMTNEIINPFSSVIGLSQQIMNLGKKECRQAAELAALIYAEASSLDFQLHNIFVAARLEAGEEIPEPAIVNINELINKELKKLSHIAEKKKIHISFHQDKNCKIFETDLNKLELILLNLLSNAINFSKEKGKVELNVLCRNKNLIIEIKDRGIGMSQEEKKRIFDRFHRANPRIQSANPGSGLGLAIVEGLLFLLKGKIEVETAPGKGTSVTVTLPEMSSGEIAFEDDLFLDEDSENEESF